MKTGKHSGSTRVEEQVRDAMASRCLVNTNMRRIAFCFETRTFSVAMSHAVMEGSILTTTAHSTSQGQSKSITQHLLSTSKESRSLTELQPKDTLLLNARPPIHSSCSLRFSRALPGPLPCHGCGRYRDGEEIGVGYRKA